MMWKEWKEFALRGNVVDMAIGIIIGSAFTPIVKSLVGDVLMPPLGLLFGDTDFTDRFLVLATGTTPPPYPTLAAAQEAGAVTINYGVFVNTVVAFLLISIAVFFIVRGINRMRRSEEGAEPSEPTTRTCPHCLSTIPLKATRCAFCTAELPPGGTA